MHLVRVVKDRLNALTESIIGAALEVHRVLGPGLLENAYQTCLTVELLNRGLSLERQRPLPVVYKNQRVDCGYRLDLVVEDLVIVEIKAVERLEGCTRCSCFRTSASRGVRWVSCSIFTRVF